MEYLGFGNKEFWDFSISFGFIIFNLPFTMMRDLYSLRHFSSLLLCGIAYIIIIMIIYFFKLFDTHKIIKEAELVIIDIDLF